MNVSGNEDRNSTTMTQKTNIRIHAGNAIRHGMPARFDVVNGQPGVQFLADDCEFVEFADLGYHPSYGYYRLSKLPNVESECDTANPETIHKLDGEEWEGEQMFVWMDSDGYPHMLGEWRQVADLYQALGDALAGNLHPKPISEFDPAWGQNYTIASAVQEALEAGYANDEVQMADTIRAAAKAGRIRGAGQDPAGRWSLPKRTFRYWLEQSQKERRGRPKGE